MKIFTIPTVKSEKLLNQAKLGVEYKAKNKLIQ